MINASASSIKQFLECHRAWFLSSIARVDRLKPLYLTRGDALDGAVQRYLQGQAQPPDLPLEVARQLQAIRTYLPRPGTPGLLVQPAYQKRLAGVWLRGKADVRVVQEATATEARRVTIYDTKTTSDRGENRGAASDRPAYALTDADTTGGNPRPLADDIQARLYAWFEFVDDPKLDVVQVVWVYVNKDAAPKAWYSRAILRRDDVLTWFREYITPILGAMVEYADTAAGDYTTVPATLGPNGEACGLRCWVREHCRMFAGSNEYTAADLDGAVDLVTLRVRKKEDPMGFKLDDLLTDDAPPPAQDLAQALALSVAQAEAAKAAPDFQATAEQGSKSLGEAVAALGINPPQGLVVDPEPEVVTQTVTAPEPTPPAQTPRRRRGRAAAPKAEGMASGSTGPTGTALKTPEVPAPTTHTMEQIELIATQVQQLADKASSVVDECNRVLRTLSGGG